MMSSDVPSVNQEFPELADLAALLGEGGWTYPLLLSPDGPLAGVKAGPAVTETIVIHSPQHVAVARMLTADLGYDPGAVRCVLWHFSGELRDAVAELRSLPPHGEPGAPRLRRPAPGDLWTPRPWTLPR